MLTRSQTKTLQQEKPLYEVNIDFDYASKCWRENKLHVGNCHYKYICPIKLSNGNVCSKSCSKNLNTCWAHRKHSTSI